MSLLHAGFLDEIAVLKGFLISPNARVTVSVKKETTGAIGHVVEARRTRFSLVGGDEKVTVIFSSCKTEIWSAFLIVDNLCATITVVLFCINLSRACCTTRSDSTSSALVASSKSNISGFFRTALPMATLCLCPPDCCTPLSPTLVE
ncbi:PREDICTED: uncharacterized protein LOC109337077 isoform X1 [Lupinus angustifolius]|uniref:uncharacterized protein LOC109337077 isoform X1 n=1 Tax=Lupinus angustifolius TaxID=3871 RepID=UPI00092E5252|nr:PREDICTED: uncharacterized protein LOC109337077 isoform X1 [Lupinus angustifolius]XP_019429497.1 PREDICTED: uncharacterized protein LOC109337077 isoform X1 [Lupinus angustifolius]